MTLRFEFVGEVLGCKMYGALHGKFSFLIGQNELGWTASYKDAEFTGAQSSHYIQNGTADSRNSPFKTRDQAEAACRRQLKILQKH